MKRVVVNVPAAVQRQRSAEPNKRISLGGPLVDLFRLIALQILYPIFHLSTAQG